MPRYRVFVFETVTIGRSKTFDAPTEDDAVHAAEAEDWSEWSEVHSEAESAVDYVEEVQP